MIIKSLHIYSHDGRRRDVLFHSGLNVITGRSSTGKSAFSEIIEYCMGGSDFKVPEGVIQEKVGWYAIVYRFDGEEVLVAKPAPVFPAQSCSLAMVRRGAVISVPEFSELKVNDNDDGVLEALGELAGIPKNMTDVPIYNSRESFEANIKHTWYYLFQKQGIVANKDQLFYRQNEEHQPQAIKDTLPILLGVSGKDKFILESQLRILHRELKLKEKMLRQAEENAKLSEERAFGLLSEARAVGVLSPGELISPDQVIELLRQALTWRPEAVPDDDGRRISAIERELLELRERRKETQRRIDSAQQFARRAEGFQNEVAEHQDRLNSIKALPFSQATGAWQWPFAPENLEMESPIAQALLSELESLERELSAVTGERPALDSYLVSQHEEVAALGEVIRNKELELASAIAANEFVAEMGNRNNAAARVVGRVSLFLEGLVSNDELARLKNEEARLRRQVEIIERKLGVDDTSERLLSTLNNISSYIHEYAKLFDAEFSEFPMRLDMQRLTVVMDRPGRPIYMNKTGGGKNHLAYHLSALLALHRYSSKYKSPIPRFIVIDQPTQVYFPSELVYKSSDGSVENTERDADLEAVRRMFRILNRFVVEDAPGFQLIVTEHANLRDEWFQQALVEAPWTKPPALVPEDWPKSELA